MELPLTLAWCFPEMESCRRLAVGVGERFEEAIGRLIDDVGLPTAAHLEVFGPLVACWTRCGAVGNSLDGVGWSEIAQARFRGAVRTALRLARRDGSQARTAAVESRRGSLKDRARAAVEMLAAAAELADENDLRKLAAGRGTKPAAKAKRAKKRGKKPAPRKKPASDSSAPPPAGIGSDHSQLSILRCDWRGGSPLLVVAHDVPGSDARGLPIELSSGRDVLLAGSVGMELRLDGQALAPTGIWENICWESDEAMDYLELELSLERGVKVQRQLLLAREARLLLIADAVTIEKASTIEKAPGDSSSSVGQPPGVPSWEHRLRLPLADKVTLATAEETREGWLHAGRRASMVAPLGLGEWKADGRPGSLAASGQTLELYSVARGQGFYAPLLVDLDSRRLRRPVTWRRLTVAENRHILPPDAAAGFRLQIGREQWVLYRSLTGPANRTLLGINTYSEFLLGRFQRDGECKEILEVEPADD